MFLSRFILWISIRS